MHNTIADTKYGKVIYSPDDIWLGRSLGIYGEYSELECGLFKRLIEPGNVAIDCGANIGYFTLQYSHLVGAEGYVYSYEPQRLMYYTLCGNVAVNGRENVCCLQMAAGAAPGMSHIKSEPRDGMDNWGGDKVGDEGELIAISTIDQLNLVRCDFIKADVEGMEADVVRGAASTIAKFRPFLYLENDRGDVKVDGANLAYNTDLVDLVASQDYDIWFHRPPLFNPANHNRVSFNVFVFGTDKPNEYGQFVSQNMLCAPRERNFQAVIDTWEDAPAFQCITLP